MSQSVKVQVKSRTRDGQKFYEGTVEIPGLKPTKLVKKSDKTTRFGSASGVTTSAKNFAKRNGFDLEVVGQGKKAAKAKKK